MRNTIILLIALIILSVICLGIYERNQRLIKNARKFEKDMMCLDIKKIERENKRMRILAYKPITKEPMEITRLIKAHKQAQYINEMQRMVER